MSAVVYDIGYYTRMIKKRKKHGYCAAFGCYKRKTTSQDLDRPKNIKISKHTAIFKL